MKGKRFKEEQIIGILQEAESGVAVADLCRKHNCSEQSFYRGKAKYGGMEVSDAKSMLFRSYRQRIRRHEARSLEYEFDKATWPASIHGCAQPRRRPEIARKRYHRR